jgi:hypothetical protein
MRDTIFSIVAKVQIGVGIGPWHMYLIRKDALNMSFNTNMNSKHVHIASSTPTHHVRIPSNTWPLRTGRTSHTTANVKVECSSWAVTRLNTKIGLTGFRTRDLLRIRRALYRSTGKNGCLLVVPNHYVLNTTANTPQAQQEFVRGVNHNTTLIAWNPTPQCSMYGQFNDNACMGGNCPLISGF